MSPRSPLRVLVAGGGEKARLTTMRRLREAGVACHGADDVFRALALLEGRCWDVLLAEISVPPAPACWLLREARRRWPELEVVILAEETNISSAVAALRLGARQVLRLEEDARVLREVLERAAGRRRAERTAAVELERLGRRLGLLGRSAAMAPVQRRIGQLAASDAPVLVRGERGTGKRTVARAIHALSGSSGPCSVVHCADLGARRWPARPAVTDARRDLEVLFAAGGTLVLHRVEDLPLHLQARLALHLGERWGGDGEPQREAARVIATLEEDPAVACGPLRQDLRYELSGLEVRLPPLRARGDDAVLLARWFLRRGDPRRERRARLSAGARDWLREHSWPGNVAELERLVGEAAAGSGPDGVIEPAVLNAALAAGGAASRVLQARAR